MWHPKSEPTPLDDQPIQGLFFLDGDRVSPFARGYKTAMIAFGDQHLEIWPSPMGPLVHFFGEMDLPHRVANMTLAAERARYIAGQTGCGARAVGCTLRLFGELWDGTRAVWTVEYSPAPEGGLVMTSVFYDVPEHLGYRHE